MFSIPVGVIYRPSPAKVKNLKTKEYLGKARLVAASTPTNIFTGFDGAEKRARDDRPPENISYAATNLVQSHLAGRSRQQSEPPIGRHLFPPTPPPESEKPSSIESNSSAERRLARSSSVQAPRRILFDADQPNGDHTTPGDIRLQMPPQGKSRLGTIRTASEPRGPPSMQNNSARYRESSSRQPLFRETTRSRLELGFPPLTEVDDPVDSYDMYGRSLNNGTPDTHSKKQQQARYTDNGYGSDAYEDNFDDDEEFEMVKTVGFPQRSHRRVGSRKLEVKKIRVKVHSEDDTRFIMVGPTVDFDEFEAKVREKFGLKSRLRMKILDDGDMVTLGDQDDLDILVSSAKKTAKKEHSDMGKMEVSYSLYSRISCSISRDRRS